MKVSYWTVIVIVSIGTTFTIGFLAGQQSMITANQLIDSKNFPIASEPSVNTPSDRVSQSNTAAIKLVNSRLNVPRSMDDIIAEIDKLLVLIDENPKQSSLQIKLFSILDELSTDALITLASSFKNKSETQRKMLNQLVVSHLMEKAPEQALVFAQSNFPMPESAYLVAAIKAQIAEKNPELGFEYLNQTLALADEDTDLSANSPLIKALAKADLKQLVRTLAEFQDKGVKLADSLSLISYGLETNEEHLNLFNELRQLNDMSILSSVLINWVKISPSAVFDRLNEIEDIAERKKLSDTAFQYWMYDSPEAAADYHLAHASNKLEMLKEIMRIWPSKDASEALTWISAQSDIDSNRYKIDYLKKLNYSDPKFVQSHLNDIYLNDDEKIGFYRSLYKGFKSKSSSDAEQFLNTLAIKDQVLGITTEKVQPAEKRITEVNKAFRRYFDFKYKKAFALGIGEDGAYAYSYIVNKPSQSEANELALINCDQRRHKHNVENKCKIYAEGDVTLFNLTP